jgi:mitogen-activated protein kinase 1/3
MCGPTKFTVDKKYKFLKMMGGGAYGIVCSALNEKTKQKVAIKKIGNAFEDLIDAKRIYREIVLLKFI